MKTFKNFVNGSWVGAADGRTSPVINPSTGEEYARAALSGQADVDAAVDWARMRVAVPKAGYVAKPAKQAKPAKPAKRKK